METDIEKSSRDRAPANDPAAQERAGRRALRKIRRQQEGNDVEFLNITAMMDMMTILLVFMLKSFSTSTSNETMNASLALPESTTVGEVKESVTVTITPSTLLVDGEPVVAIRGGVIDASDKRDGANSLLVPRLRDNLKTRGEIYKLIAKRQGREFDGALTIIADKKTPYRLLTEVLYTAGQAEYRMYRLLLLNKKA